MEMFPFKFDQNRTKNEEFYFFDGGGGEEWTPTSKFQSQLLLVNK